MASPVDLIRELAEALQTHLPPAVDAHPPNWTAHTATLTRAQVFLAARPVVIEVGFRAKIVNPYQNITAHEFKLQGYSPGMVLACANGALNSVPLDTPCTVHVIVVPSAREP